MPAMKYLRSRVVRWIGLAAALAVITGGAAFVLLHKPVDHEADFADRLRRAGVQTGGKTKFLGHTVCDQLRNQVPAAKVVDNVQKAHLLQPSSSKVIVYWAIVDLCPEQASQNQESWRDGR